MSAFFVGTSGFSYDHWRDVFYPLDLSSSKFLSFYAQTFTTVELNVSFYRLPSAAAFKKWASETPANFIFAVKASRYLTHVKRLKDCQEPWDRFYQRALNLGSKIGPILFQFPATFTKNTQRLEEFLSLLPQQQFAFEFRHESWFCQEIYDLLKQAKASLCIADSSVWPSVEKITTNFVFLRFHGGRQLYASRYSIEELKPWAVKISNWLNQGLKVYAYFNNDAYGFAVKNALELKDLVKQSHPLP